MESVREAWTDERLDDLSQRVDEGFRDAASRRSVRRSARFAPNGSVALKSVRFALKSARSAEMHCARNQSQSSRSTLRLDGIQRAMIYGFVSLSTATLAGMLAIATQL